MAFKWDKEPQVVDKLFTCFDTSAFFTFNYFSKITNGQSEFSLFKPKLTRRLRPSFFFDFPALLNWNLEIVIVELKSMARLSSQYSNNLNIQYVYYISLPYIFNFPSVSFYFDSIFFTFLPLPFVDLMVRFDFAALLLVSFLLARFEPTVGKRVASRAWIELLEAGDVEDWTALSFA